MTDQSITQSEFQRFQDQLISLKEGKYRTEERCEILCRKLKEMEIKCNNLERELVKSNEFKNKFRSGRDIEILLDDNQVLRDRMSATEANFKLQNEILRNECERLLSENERLKCQMETYKLPSTIQNMSNTDDIIDGIEHDEQHYKLRSLKFEVAKLIDEKDIIETNNAELTKLLEDCKVVEKELVLRVDSLLNDKSKLIVENNRMKEELETNCHLHSVDIENISQSHTKTLNELSLKFEQALESQRQSGIAEQIEIKLLCEAMEIDFKKRIDELNIERRSREAEYESLLDESRIKLDNVVEEWQRKVDDNDSIHKMLLSEHEIIYSGKIADLEAEVSRLQDKLHFAEEELQVYGKKNKKMLKDVKRQLEKEIKLSQEVQSKLELQSSENSQNSQTRVHEYLGGSHQMYSTDDQSSLHSSSYNGAIYDGQWPSSSIAVTDEELRNLLDRLTNVQNDQCEFKRKIETMNHEKSQLIETIKRQERIILNYIKNRGGSDNCDMNADMRPSTAEALTLNGLMSSPVHSHTSLGTLLSKVKHTIKSLNPHEMLTLSAGERFSYRVTDVDVKQLQRVCEELMMRCLNLETDLQAAVDLNVQLTASLATGSTTSSTISSTIRPPPSLVSPPSPSSRHA